MLAMPIQRRTQKDKQAMGKIVVRFTDLLERKQKAEGRTITLETVALETGLAYATVLRWYKGQINRLDFGTLEKLCEYFGVKPGALIDLEA